MSVEADATHIIAEIRTFRRRLDELAETEQDDAPQDSGWQLRTRQDVLQVVRETIKSADKARGVTFCHMPDVRIRLEPGGRRAHIEEKQEGEWHSSPMEQEDLEDLDHILTEAGKW